MNKSLKIALAVGALAATGGAYAATATTNFPVTTQVLATCQVTAGALLFANFAPGGPAVDQTSTVNVRCTTGTAYFVGLDAGTFGGATVTTRRMSGSGTAAGSSLEYFLYSDAFVTNWGNTGAERVSGTGTGMGAGNDHTVQGRVPNSIPNQVAAAGPYLDTIGVTVTY
jgi:spore coat protein U-like protein